MASVVLTLHPPEPQLGFIVQLVVFLLFSCRCDEIELGDLFICFALYILATVCIKKV